MGIVPPTMGIVMKKKLSNLGASGAVLWVGIVILFGVIASKIVEHNLLENTFLEILTILLLIAIVALSWVAGWSYRSNQDALNDSNRYDRNKEADSRDVIADKRELAEDKREKDNE